MDLTVFYSWQSDRPAAICRYLIRDAIREAVSRINRDSTVEECPRLEHDTKGLSGIPAIAEAIFKKIEQAAVFVADVTFVGSTIVDEGAVQKALPNPNVLMELGYAAKAIGWERIICVFNSTFGSIADQIFNLRHRRNAVTYELRSGEPKTEAQKQLSSAIETAVRSVLQAEHNGVDEVLARLDAYSQVFLRRFATQTVIVPRPTNEFRLGVPANDLDTPSYNAAVASLRQLNVIRSVVNPTNHSVAFTWTHLGDLVLRKLGLRN